MNSVTRYYLNNMQDGYKQNGIDLLLGKYKVKKSPRSPFAPQDEGLMTMMIALLLSLFYTFAPMHLQSKWLLFIIIGWLIFFYFINKALRVSSQKIVNQPRLINHNSHIKLLKSK